MQALLRSVLLAVVLLAGAGPSMAQDKTVKVYNWSDYIDQSILSDFTTRTGIKVIYDTYDSNELLEAKLLAGRTGYDVVVPTGNFLARQVQAGVFRNLDRSKLPNWKNLDSELMAQAAKYDPGNQHAFIYMWGTTGIAYNVEKVKKRLPNVPINSWALLFDPQNAKKLADCGIYLLDAPDDILPNALRYLGEDPDSKDVKVIEKAADVIAKIRPHVRKFHSSEVINAMANGDICAAIMYSGDAGIAAKRAQESKKKVKEEIRYVIPQEGALLWFDMMAIPKDATNVDHAHTFMNYLLEPEVIAKSSNEVTYPNAVPASLPLISREVKNNPNLFPPEELRQKLFVITPYDQPTQRAVSRMWTKIKSGK